MRSFANFLFEVHRAKRSSQRVAREYTSEKHGRIVHSVGAYAPQTGVLSVSACFKISLICDINSMSKPLSK